MLTFDTVADRAVGLTGTEVDRTLVAFAEIEATLVGTVASLETDVEFTLAVAPPIVEAAAEVVESQTIPCGATPPATRAFAALRNR